MRPSFSYIDEAESAKRAQKIAEEKQAEEAAEAEESRAEFEADDELKPVTVQFKKKESASAALKRKQQHAYIKQQEDEEKWIDLELNTTWVQTHDTFEKLFFPQREHFVKFDVKKENYLQMINPPAPSEEGHKDATRKIISRANLKTQNIDQQLLTILANAHVLHFDSIKSIVSGYSSNNELIALLEHIATVVQGCWVMKSEIILEGRSRFARDFILCTLAKQDIVTRSYIIEKNKNAS